MGPGPPLYDRAPINRQWVLLNRNFSYSHLQGLGFIVEVQVGNDDVFMACQNDKCLIPTGILLNYS